MSTSPHNKATLCPMLNTHLILAVTSDHRLQDKNNEQRASARQFLRGALSQPENTLKSKEKANPSNLYLPLSISNSSRHHRHVDFRRTRFMSPPAKHEKHTAEKRPSVTLGCPLFPESACEGFFEKNICRTTSHLHLHIFTSAHPHSHLYLCSSSHLHSQLPIYISAHLHTLTSTSLLIFIFTHLHLCSCSHLHLYISAHLHILTSTSHIFTSHLHLTSSPLALLNFLS